jgi:hypothetical protein
MRRLIAFALLCAGCPTQKDTRFCNTSADCSAPYGACDTVKHECEIGVSGGDGGGPLDMSVVACNDSSTCPASTPVCSGGVCGPCNGNASACMSYHSATPVCGASGACVECSSNTDCTPKAATPFCGPTQSCVECLKSSDCTPHVCGSDNACRACQTNAECPSGICGDSGNCVDPSQILLVDNGGMTVAACDTARPTRNGLSPADAYCDISEAFFKPYILVTGHGAAFPYSPFQVSSSVTIVGTGSGYPTPAPASGAAVIAGSPTVNAVVFLSAGVGASYNLVLDGFEITSGNTKDGVDCNGQAATHSSLTARHLYIHDMGDGIAYNNCDITVTDTHITKGGSPRLLEETAAGSNATILRSLFDNSNSDGVDITGGKVVIDQCVFANNPSGNGVQINQNAGQQFSVTNSFFYNNGYTPLEILPTGGVLQFLTVVRNGHTLSCNANALQGSIVRDNNEVDGGLQGNSGCIPVATTTWLDPAPAFRDISSPATYDFHLATDTPAHISANQACCIDKIAGTPDGGTALSDHDVDGTKRPKGAGYDVGAHEAM